MAFSVVTRDEDQLLRRRLQSQLLSPLHLLEPSEIVARLGAVQAQDYTAAKWAIGMRSEGLTDADVEHVFNKGLILRTHVLRPTWHFVAPADIRWLLALSGPRVKASMAYHCRAAGLDDRMVQRGTAALVRALRGGRMLTRTELSHVVERAGLEPSGDRSTLILMHAELDGVICSGARCGKQMTYALLEERVTPTRPYDRDEALAELATRYCSSHGPATVADFAWWSGLTMREARRGIEIAAARLVASTKGNITYWASPESSTVSRKPTAHLIPSWDEYTVAYRDRGMLVDPGTHPRFRDDPDLLSNAVLIDGRIAGTWRRTLQKDKVIVDVVAHRGWSAAELGRVNRAARRYGEFLQLPVGIRIVEERA